MTFMNIPKLPEKKLQDFNVSIVYLFGSQLQGATTPLSDIDIGVVFNSLDALKDSLNLYTKLYDIFTDIFPGPYEIDIVFMQQTSLVLQYEIIKHGKILYESNPIFRADYEEQIIKEYMDFEPLLRESSAALLSRK